MGLIEGVVVVPGQEHADNLMEQTDYLPAPGNGSSYCYGETHYLVQLPLLHASSAPPCILGATVCMVYFNIGPSTVSRREAEEGQAILL